MDMSEKEL